MFQGLAAAFCFLLVSSIARAEIHFIGLPNVRISMSEGEVVFEKVLQREKSKYAVVITEKRTGFFLGLARR